MKRRVESTSAVIARLERIKDLATDLAQQIKSPVADGVAKAIIKHADAVITAFSAGRN